MSTIILVVGHEFSWDFDVEFISLQSSKKLMFSWRTDLMKVFRFILGRNLARLCESPPDKRENAPHFFICLPVGAPTQIVSIPQFDRGYD